MSEIIHLTPHGTKSYLAISNLPSMPHQYHHGQLLKQLLKERNIEVPEFFELLKEEISSLSTVYKLLDSDTIGKARLCLICTLFGVSPTYFGKPADYFDPLPNAVGNQQNKRLVIYNYIKERKGNYSSFANEYFGAFVECIKKTAHSLYVLDYLANKYGLKLKDNIAYFHVQNKAYFETLQQHIDRRRDEHNKIQFDYRRICQLPLYAFPEGEEIAFERKVEFVVESLFEETFEHFCWCYKNIGEEQFKLYVVQNPIRLYSYYIFDKQALVSEYLRFDMYGASIPDVLFVDRADEYTKDKTAQKLIDNYAEEFEKMEQETVLSKQKIIPKKTFFFSIAGRLARIQEKINVKMEELQEKEEVYNALIDKYLNNYEIVPTTAEKEQQNALQAEKHKINKEIEELLMIEENLHIKRNIAKKYTD